MSGHCLDSIHANCGIITVLKFIIQWFVNNSQTGDYRFQYCHNHFLGSDDESTEIHNPMVCKLWHYGALHICTKNSSDVWAQQAEASITKLEKLERIRM